LALVEAPDTGAGEKVVRYYLPEYKVNESPFPVQFWCK
jgi:hypothetical protein